ncbi:MAG: cobalamin-dependent protein, partial [Desulfococcaceae bacterium]
MKALLVNPYCLEDRIHAEDAEAAPIGLFTLAAALRDQGVEAGILNAARLRDRPEQIRAALTEWKPDLLGFSVLNANRWGAVDIARMAREINPAVRIVFGGVAATFLWEHFLTEFPE